MQPAFPTFATVHSTVRVSPAFTNSGMGGDRDYRQVGHLGVRLPLVGPHIDVDWIAGAHVGHPEVVEPGLAEDVSGRGANPATGINGRRTALNS